MRRGRVLRDWQHACELRPLLLILRAAAKRLESARSVARLQMVEDQIAHEEKCEGADNDQQEAAISIRQ